MRDARSGLTIPDDQAWHVRGIPTTHRGPFNDWAARPDGRRLRCGLIINATYVAGPAPSGEPCPECSRWTDA